MSSDQEQHKQTRCKLGLLCAHQKESRPAGSGSGFLGALRLAYKGGGSPAARMPVVYLAALQVASRRPSLDCLCFCSSSVERAPEESETGQCLRLQVGPERRLLLIMLMMMMMIARSFPANNGNNDDRSNQSGVNVFYDLLLLLRSAAYKLISDPVGCKLSIDEDTPAWLTSCKRVCSARLHLSSWRSVEPARCAA